jgi:nicotinic acid mononucleotide adenylyltransferase
VPHWKQPQEIFRLAAPLVVRRAGQPQPDLSDLGALCAADHPPQLIDMPAMLESSTEIRRRIAANRSINDLVPAEVAQFIAERGLYR